MNYVSSLQRISRHLCRFATAARFTPFGQREDSFRGKLLLNQGEFSVPKVIKKLGKWKRIDSPTSIFQWRIKWRVLKTNQDVKLLKGCLTNEKHGERDVYFVFL